MTRPGILRIQLWSWNYAPEPTAMGPIASLWAEEMVARGHRVSVVTAFPHYPPIWPQRWLPRRDEQNGIPVIRLPLLIGHATTGKRVLEEATYAVSATMAGVAMRRRADVAVVVSPSFLALQPVLRLMRLRRVPTILWLQDILPDAAATTGLVGNRLLLGGAGRLERAAYRMADRIVVISESFRENLIEKGVPAAKIAVVYNPATRGFDTVRNPDAEPRILAMGNIGLSQGLAEHVAVFDAADLAAQLVIVGTGEAADAVRASVRGPRVEICGLVDDATLERELHRTTIGLITQRADIAEFNVPSRLMTFMARGVPVVASVRANSEVARIVSDSGAGWVTSLESFETTLEHALSDPVELERRSKAALTYAKAAFDVGVVVDRFEAILADVVARRQAIAVRG